MKYIKRMNFIQKKDLIFLEIVHVSDPESDELVSTIYRLN